MTTETLSVGSGEVRVLTKDDCMRDTRLGTYFDNRANRYNIKHKIFTVPNVANTSSKGKEVLKFIMETPPEESWNDLEKALPLQTVRFPDGNLALKFEPALDKERILVATKGRLVMITRKEDAVKQDPFTIGGELLDKADKLILENPNLLSEYAREDSDYQYEAITLEDATESYLKPLMDSARMDMSIAGSTTGY